MKKNLLILTIITKFSFGQIAQKQQFTIIQLCSLINDVKSFESNMLRVGNTPKENYIDTSYSADYVGGGFSASRDIPTNASKYDEIWRWPDGRILTSTQIDDELLDEEYKIRNKLRVDADQPINKNEIKGFTYYKDKIENLVRNKKITSKFYKDYDGNLLTGVYKYESNSYKALIGSITFWKNSKTIEYSFFDESLYRVYMSQISKISKYIETKKDDSGDYLSYYRYGTLLISTKIEINDDYTTYIINIKQ